MGKIDWDSVIADLQGQGIPINGILPNGMVDAPLATPAQHAIIQDAIQAAIDAHRNKQELIADEAKTVYASLVTLRDEFDDQTANLPTVREAVYALMNAVIPLMDLVGLGD